MCGIIAALAQRNVMPILVEGLHRLEYRGYDSVGIAVLLNKGQELKRVRVKGKVAVLEKALAPLKLKGQIGIAHTRWATHGEPSEANAHPLQSRDQISIVLNGVIENYAPLKTFLQSEGYEFTSETDAEVIAHLIHRETAALGSYIHGVKRAVARLEGLFALVILNKQEPLRLIGVRQGLALVLGVGVEEYFLSSDTYALAPVTHRFVHLEDGDIVDIAGDGYSIEDANKQLVKRSVTETEISEASTIGKGNYKHYMLKEIYEQSAAIEATLKDRINESGVQDDVIGVSDQDLARVKNIHFVACGTSYHAAYVARYWVEKFAGVSCSVEVASEYRYREVQVPPDTLYVTLSQSGETADTLAALEESKKKNYISRLAVCNVAESSIVRSADACLLTHAGPEICVASTKAFTTQLAALWLLILAVGKHKGLSSTKQQEIVKALLDLPRVLEAVFKTEPQIRKMAEDFVDKQHSIFLGRGPFYPIALEGALKLKEISYIHSEGYPAGELKHGPLALIDSEVPIVAVAPNNNLLEKLKSNIEVVRTRGGRLYIFAEENTNIENNGNDKIITLPPCAEYIAPIAYLVPLQLLAYHVAVMLGTDVDQPRNLAKSVTVE